MAEDTAETVLIKSALSTFRFFVVLGVGIVASKWPKGEPLLTRETSRNFSRVGMDLFLPCLLLASIGGTLNPAALRDSWHLVVGSTLSIGISSSLASVLGWLLMRRDARQTFRPVQMAIAFPNALVFPLLLLDALCEQDVINGDYDGDSIECYEQATGMIFIYTAVWQIWFFAWGFYCLKNDNALEVFLNNQTGATAAAAAAASAAAASAVSHDEEDPSASARSTSPGTSLEGQVVPSPLHGQRAAATKPENSEREASASWPGLANKGGSRVAGSVLEGIVAAGSDSGSGNGDGVDGFWARAKKRAWGVVGSPVIVALITGIVICVIAPLQDMLFHNPDAFLRPLGGAIQAVGVPTVPVSTLVMAGSLVAVSATAGANPAPGGEAESAFPIWRRSRFVMGGLLIFLRLIMIPAAFFGLFWLANTQSSVMGENRLMHLILLIEFAMPSASLMISVLNQIHMPSTAGFLSRLFVWQFAASSITVSFWTALAINMLY